MNNILVLVMLGICALAIIFSMINGLARGSIRSIVRLILVVISFVVAWKLNPMVVDKLLGIQIEGQPVVEFLKGKLPEDFASLADLIVPLLTAIVGVISFFVSFLCLLFVSQILFWFLKIFVKKGKKKHALIGMLVGIVQGAFIGLCLTAPLTGLICDIAPLTTLQVGDEVNVAEMIPESIDIQGFADSKFTEIEMKVAGKFYTEQLSTFTYTDGNGEEVTTTIKGQVEVISATAKIANELLGLSSLMEDFGEGFDASNAEDLKDVFAKLGEINGELDEETQEMVMDLISSVADGVAESMGVDLGEMGINLDNLDLSNIAAEGELIVDLMTYADPANQEELDIGNIVTELSESTLILPLLESNEIEVELDSEQKEEALNAINDLPEDTPEETVNALKALLGLE